MASDKLTDRAVKTAAAGKHFDGRGLYLHVLPTGTRAWRLKYRHEGKERVAALGVYPDVTLAAARDKRDALRRQIGTGVDPIAQKREQREARAAQALDTFEGVAEAYYRHNVNGWSANHARDVRRTLDELIATLGPLPMAKITRQDVAATFAPIIERGALVYCQDARLYVRAVWKFYNGQRSTPLYDPSQTVAIPKAAKAKHHAALPYGEVGDFLRKLSFSSAMPATRIAARLLLLTGLRTTELRAARWEEIDERAKLWRIPETRMKSGEAHLVPLSPQALALIEALRTITGDGALMFPNANDPDEPITENTVLFTLYRMGYKGRLTGHGFRAMLSTWANECGRYPADAIERQLAHAPRDRVRAAYNRGTFLDERRKMLCEWADYCDAREREAAAGSLSVVA